MPRLPRSYIKTSFFHVITQRINKSYIFEKAEDIKYYIKIMYHLTKELKIKIVGYCPNPTLDSWPHSFYTYSCQNT